MRYAGFASFCCKQNLRERVCGFRDSSSLQIDAFGCWAQVLPLATEVGV